MANTPGFLWHCGPRMDFNGSDCKGVWHKTARNFPGSHCRFGHYIDKSFMTEIIKLKDIIPAFGTMEKNFPTSCNSSPASWLVAGSLHFASDDFLDQVLKFFNGNCTLHRYPLPGANLLSICCQNMDARARVPAESRPIGSIRLQYETLACMILGRVGPFVEAAQPEEQHGFGSKRRIEKHLATANSIVDKSWRLNMPIWIISLDLFKKMRIGRHFGELYVSEQGISDQMVSFSQN